MKRHVALVVFVSAFGLARPAWSRSIPAPAPTPTRPTDGLAHGPWRAQKVDRGLVLRSAQPTHAELERLTRRGLKSVVSLRLEGSGDRDVAKGLDLRLLRLHIPDGGIPTMNQAVRFLDFVTKRPNEPVLVHCRAGVGRTGEMIAAYRIAVDGWKLERALTEAKLHGMHNGVQDRWVREFASKVASGEIPRYPRPRHGLVVTD